MVGYTRSDLAVWREVMARSLAAAGAEPGQLIQIAYGYGLFTGGPRASTTAPSTWGSPWCPSPRATRSARCCCSRTSGPHGLACTPSFALYIGESMREQGSDPRAIGLSYGLFGAEPWTEAMRGAARGALGLPGARTSTGLSEIIGPGVAGECVEARDGLHVNEDHFLPEIVDPATGEPLPAGQEGELVLTALTKEALPMLRYRTGDVTRLDPAPCRCGRTTVRMARVKGRTDDMLVIKGVNVYPSQLEAALLTVADAGSALSARGGPDPGVPDASPCRSSPPRRRGARVGRLRGRAGRSSPRSPPGWRSACAATSALNPEIAIVPPKTIPAQRGQGGAGGGKEIVMAPERRRSPAAGPHRGGRAHRVARRR